LGRMMEKYLALLSIGRAQCNLENDGSWAHEIILSHLQSFECA
jgi:hypothetical protein